MTKYIDLIAADSTLTPKDRELANRSALVQIDKNLNAAHKQIDIWERQITKLKSSIRFEPLVISTLLTQIKGMNNVIEELNALREELF